MSDNEVEKTVPVLETIGKYLESREKDSVIVERVAEIAKEFTEGFRFLQGHKKSATFFGSTNTKEGELYYEKARELAHRLAKELDYTVVSGGGPGIMEAANRGAFEADGDSLGLLIKLPDGQPTNRFVTKSLSFYYFFARKVCLAFGAELLIFFPGGFGTLDEFFEIVTLFQTKKIHDAPLICFGSEYWGSEIKKFMQDKLLAQHMISAEDANLFTITDSIDEVMEIAKKAKVNTSVPFHLI